MNYNHSGFTLIALLIIIVALGILAVLAFLRYVDISIESRVAVRDGAVGGLKAPKAVAIARTKANPTITSPTILRPDRRWSDAPDTKES